MAAAHKIMNEYSFIYQGRFTVSSEIPPALSSWADSILIILFYTKGIAQEVQPQPSKTVGMRTYIQHEQPFTNPGTAVGELWRNRPPFGDRRDAG